MFGIRKLKREVARLGTTNGDPTDHPLLSFYVTTTSKLLGTERCSIFILNPTTRRVWLKRGTGISDQGIEVDVDGSVVGRVIASGQPVIENDMTHREGVHHHVDSDTGFVTRNMVCVPIRTSDGGEVVGAVQALNKGDGGFTPADQAELTELAHYLQLTIETIYRGQEMAGTMARLVRVAQAALVAAAIAAVAVTTVMVLYVITIVTLRS